MIEAIVLTSSPALKGKARQWGASYRRIALVLVDRDVLAAEGIETPRMISDRARGVVRILRERTLHVGQSERSEGRRFLAELKADAAQLTALLAGISPAREPVLAAMPGSFFVSLAGFAFLFLESQGAGPLLLEEHQWAVRLDLAQGEGGCGPESERLLGRIWSRT